MFRKWDQEKAIIFLLVVTWFEFSTEVDHKSAWILAMNQDMEMFRSSQVLGKAYDGDGIR